MVIEHPVCYLCFGLLLISHAQLHQRQLSEPFKSFKYNIHIVFHNIQIDKHIRQRYVY
jgi:hypothetical protein